jgi:hypothetical protein
MGLEISFFMILRLKLEKIMGFGLCLYIKVLGLRFGIWVLNMRFGFGWFFRD